MNGAFRYTPAPRVWLLNVPLLLDVGVVKLSFNLVRVRLSRSLLILRGLRILRLQRLHHDGEEVAQASEHARVATRDDERTRDEVAQSHWNPILEEHIRKGDIGYTGPGKKTNLEEVEVGNQMPKYLPVMSCACPQRNTAMHTIQLQPMPFKKVVRKSLETFFSMILIASAAVGPSRSPHHCVKY